MNDQERLTARGNFEELQDKKQALTSEIIALSDAIRRKIPEINDATTLIIPHMDPAGAVSLLERLRELHDDYKCTEKSLSGLADRWGFKRNR